LCDGLTYFNMLLFGMSLASFKSDMCGWWRSLQ